MAQPLEASPSIQRMASPHVPNIAVESFEEVGDDKGLSKNESDSFCKMYEIVNKQMIF